MDKKELIESIRIELRKQGIVRSVKTHVKKEICQILVKGPKVRRIQSLEQAAIRSLIMDCLICEKMECTQSVFLSESGLDEYRLSIEDILKAFEIQKGSKLSDDLLTTAGGGPKSFKDSAVYQLMAKRPEMVTNISNSAIHKSSQTMPLGVEKDSLATTDNISADVVAVESRMFAFQKECEERERKRVERDLEQFKQSARTSMEQDFAHRCFKEVEETRQAMTIKADKSTEVMKSKEEQLKKDFLAREKEREYQHLAIRQELAKEIEVSKQRETENKNFIEIEQRKLQLEEQRVKHILMSAEAKLEFAEIKEKEIRESAANEFNRVRLAAKQTYDDASESVQKQSAFYAKELDDLNALRKNMSSQLKKSELIQIEVSDLRVENEKLRRDLNRALVETDQVKSSSSANETRIQRDLCLVQDRNLELELELNHMKEEIEHCKAMTTSADEEHKKMSLSMVSRVNGLGSELKRSKLEKELLVEEVKDLRLLLSRSEGALETINGHGEGKDSRVRPSNGDGNNDCVHDQERLEPRLLRQADEERFQQQQITRTLRYRPVDVQTKDPLMYSSTHYQSNHQIIGQKVLQSESTYGARHANSNLVHDAPQFCHLKSLLKQDYSNFHQEDRRLESTAIRAETYTGSVPNDIEIEDLSQKSGDAEDSIDRDDESKHSLETSITWDTATRRIVQPGNVKSDQALLPGMIVGTEINFNQNTEGELQNDGRKRPDGDDRREQVPLSRTTKQDDNIPLEISQDDDLEETGYASSDFETESTSGV